MNLKLRSPSDTLRSSGPLFEVAVVGTVPAYVTHVPALETSPVLRFPLLLLDVFVLVVFLLLHPGEEKTQARNQSVQAHTQMIKALLNFIKASVCLSRTSYYL